MPEEIKSEMEGGQAEVHLQELIARLKRSERDLSPETQRIVEESTAKPVTSKQMHAAVKKLDQARNKFKQAITARKNLHGSWTTYIDESIKRWTKFAEDFASKDKDLEDRVKGAAEKLQEAKAHLDDVKEKHTKQDENVLQDIDLVSDENMDEENMKVETSETIKKGIASMLEGFDKVRIRVPTGEETEEGSASKKPRVEPGGKDSATLGARALQPFGGADK